MNVLEFAVWVVAAICAARLLDSMEANRAMVAIDQEYAELVEGEQ